MQCIQLPSGDVFNFAVADIPTDVPKGSFECIQKTGKGIVEPLGDIRQRITIHATEDSFNNTKQKMTLAEEESKKSWLAVSIVPCLVGTNAVFSSGTVQDFLRTDDMLCSTKLGRFRESIGRFEVWAC